MARHYMYTNNENDQQSVNDDSYIGGLPKLPQAENIPICSLCSKEMTFFLQVAFPTDHPWVNDSTAIFSCVDCVNEDYFIPEMLNSQLYNVDVPKHFQINTSEILDLSHLKQVQGYLFVTMKKGYCLRKLP